MGEVSNRATPSPARQHASLDRSVSGDVLVVRVSGLVDERFVGFGDVGTAKAIVIDVNAMTRMTSFGVRQWLRAMDALPKTITDRYIIGCQMFFVDQLNMVLNFGGSAQILTAVAPYTCSSCGNEAGELIDLHTESAVITRGGSPDRSCRVCGAKLELDESPASYFAFATKYPATKVRADVAQHLAQLGLYYTTADPDAADKPPKVIKLVQGAVSYFRIIGTLGGTFRARPFIVGAEGEIVIDVADVARFDPLAQHEWRRLVKGLSAQVTTVTLVDISQDFLAMAPDSFAVANNVFVASVLVPYHCTECGRRSQHSYALSSPIPTTTQICSTCGGTTVNQLPPQQLAALAAAASAVPPASAKLIARREDMISRAVTDEKVTQQQAAETPPDAPDTILGNYKIIRKLSAGGMAEVFLAKQIGIGGFEKPVALKRIQYKALESKHLAVDMFLNEAKIAGRLAHPNIVQVLDVGQVGGELYLAMEYVNGKDLREVIKMLQGSSELVPLALACYIVKEVAQALHFAYWSNDHEGNRLSVVHRDVTPHNIILGFDGAVKLLDFGVAMSSVTEQDEPMVVGKWSYMSPEHTTKQIDHRSDIFSLGVTLYLLCSGRMPFFGANPVAIIAQIEAGQYAPLADMPQPLIDLIKGMISAHPDVRPQTGQAVATALSEIMRAYHLECTSLDISAFLAKVFAYEMPVNAPDGADDHDTVAMDMTTIRLAMGSAETPAQPTPQAVPRVVTPKALSAASEVSFTPSPAVPESGPVVNLQPRATVIWIGAAIAAFVLVIVLLLAR